MDWEDIMLSEISKKKERQIPHGFTYMWIQKNKNKQKEQIK